MSSFKPQLCNQCKTFYTAIRNKTHVCKPSFKLKVEKKKSNGRNSFARSLHQCKCIAIMIVKDDKSNYDDDVDDDDNDNDNDGSDNDAVVTEEIGRDDN